MAEDYMTLVANLMYPGTSLGTFGYDPSQGKYPLDRTTSLGFLGSGGGSVTSGAGANSTGNHHHHHLLPNKNHSLLGLRTPTILEQWSPYEIALFEAGMMEFGKNFARIHRTVLSQRKSTKEIVAFYYIWKKTSHYSKWKQEYVPDEELHTWCQDANKKREKR